MRLRAVSCVFAIAEEPDDSFPAEGRHLFEDEVDAIVTSHRNDLVVMRRMLRTQPSANAHLVAEIAETERRLASLLRASGRAPVAEQQPSDEEIAAVSSRWSPETWNEIHQEALRRVARRHAEETNNGC